MCSRLLVCIFLFCSLGAYAQTWMPGYEFRRKITFDKSKIEGDFINGVNGRVDYDVADFPVLVELEDDAFKYRPATACSRIFADPEGRNVAFATAAAPAVKLSFQIESYDPVLGKYRCWVKIPSLASARTATPATAVYFYYGGSVLHENYSAAGLNTWNGEYTSIWHMNGENSDLGSVNVKTGLAAESLKGHGFIAEDRIPGKIAEAVDLNGENQWLHTAGNGNVAFSISAWIKWNGGVDPQVIATNDSVAAGHTGWQLSINPDGKLAMKTYRTAGLSYSYTSVYAVAPNVWTHIACYFSVTGSSNSGLGLLINGASAGSVGGAGVRLATGGYLSVGRSKVGTQYFNGAMDELRLYNVAKPVYWLRNEYKNQYDPASFYSLGAEEFSPSWATFTGATNSDWATNANWLNAIKPVSGAKVRVLTGKATKVTGSDVVFGQLVLEAGATLSAAVNVQLNCDVKLAAGAILNMDAGKKLILGGNGSKLSGVGTANTEHLEVNAVNPDSEILLETDVKVSKSLKLNKGILDSNGKLWLMSSGSSTARLLPVDDLLEAQVKGLVNVQHFIDGSFPNPSSGRGWRLLSSPVIHSGVEGSYQYGFQDVKSAAFVTGKDGVVNGFDASPNNGATIYTHDQNLPGTLAKKYVSIPNIDAQTRMGRGFYMYSRGSRVVANAYRDQVQVQPFSNPGPYVITYKGQLYQGNLTVKVFNRNMGGEGDGFNLLGNPYASPIRWGDLIKVNISPFVWLWDPLNNAYKVSDDPEEVIPAGSGFFVKVISGFGEGAVTFTEGCKVQ